MKKFVKVACAGIATAALALSLSGCGNRQLHAGRLCCIWQGELVA